MDNKVYLVDGKEFRERELSIRDSKRVGAIIGKIEATDGTVPIELTLEQEAELLGLLLVGPDVSKDVQPYVSTTTTTADYDYRDFPESVASEVLANYIKKNIIRSITMRKSFLSLTENTPEQ